MDNRSLTALLSVSPLAAQAHMRISMGYSGFSLVNRCLVVSMCCPGSWPVCGPEAESTGRTSSELRGGWTPGTAHPDGLAPGRPHRTGSRAALPRAPRGLSQRVGSPHFLPAGAPPVHLPAVTPRGPTPTERADIGACPQSCSRRGPPDFSSPPMRGTPRSYPLTWSGRCDQGPGWALGGQGVWGLRCSDITGRGCRTKVAARAVWTQAGPVPLPPPPSMSS